MTTSAFELSFVKGDLRHQAGELCRHLGQCAANRGRFFSAALMLERVHRVVAPRFVTTVFVSTVLLLVCGGL